MPKQIPITGLLPGGNYIVTVSGMRPDGSWTAFSQGFPFTTIPDTAPPDPPTNLVTDFTTNDLIISWNPAASIAATDFKDFEVSLTANSKTLVYYTASSSFTLTYLNNLAGFTSVQTSIAVSIKARDTSNNTSLTALTGTAVKAAISVAPSITAVGSLGGYDVTIDYTNLPPGATYVELFEYTASTGATGKTSVWKGPVTINKASIVKPLTAVTYFVDAYYVDSFGQYGTVASNPRTSVLTQAPSPIDTTPPPVPTIAAGTATITTLPIVITTTAAADTAKYALRYKPTSGTNSFTPDYVFVSSGNTTTNYTITGLIPNTSYTIEVASRDSLDNQSAYSTQLVTSTAAQTVPNISSATLSAKAFAITASWSDPSGPPTPIAGYTVELWDDLAVDVKIQTADTIVPTYTFPGLAGGKTYYVKVFTKDIYGVLSSGYTSTGVALNTAGGATDGIAPASSPTPTVNPLFGALEVKWTAITNADPVTYEVHVSTATGFTPSALTKSLETTGTFAVIKTLPGTSTALTYGTPYYVKLIAKDYDGSAAAGSQASATPSQIDNGDIAANAVRANVIQAGTITATQVDATNLFVGKSFAVGTSAGTYDIVIDATGNGTTTPYKMYSGAGNYQNADTGFYLDSDGKFSLRDKLKFDGTNLTLTGTITASAGGTIGGFNINADSLTAGSGSTSVGIAPATYPFYAGNTTASSAPFRVDTAGNMTATKATITGAITASSGSFTGNVNIGAAGSLYSGTLDVNGNLTTTGYKLSNTQFIFAGASGAIKTTLSGTDGKLTTEFATIGGWSVNATQISSTGIILESSATAPQIYVSKTIGATTYTAGIKPGSSAVTDKVIWAGDPNSPNFYVTADGKLNATAATISGTITGNAISIDTNNYWNTSGNAGKLRVGNANSYMLFDPAGSGGNGTLTITGTVDAPLNITNPGISNGSITGSSINVGPNKFTVDTSGNMSTTGTAIIGGTATISGTLRIVDPDATDSTAPSIRLISSNYTGNWWQNPSINMNIVNGLVVRGPSGAVVAKFPVDGTAITLAGFTGTSTGITSPTGSPTMVFGGINNNITIQGGVLPNVVSVPLIVV